MHGLWAHEMNHRLDYRANPELAEQCLPGHAHRIEATKYIMQYMWWVQRYPGDAASDWMPINSGLALAQLAEGEYVTPGRGPC